MAGTLSPDLHEDKTIRNWGADTGIVVDRHLRGGRGGVVSVAYGPDGRHIISGSYDKTLRIWDAKTGGAGGKPLERNTNSGLFVA